MTYPAPAPEEEAVQSRAIRIFERASGRPWSEATETEERLARSAARAELWGESLETNLWARSEAEQCFRGD